MLRTHTEDGSLKADTTGYYVHILRMHLSKRCYRVLPHTEDGSFKADVTGYYNILRMALSKTEMRVGIFTEEILIKI